MNQKQNLNHILATETNKMLVTHLLKWFVYQRNSSIQYCCFSGKLSVWEDTDSCAKDYIFVLVIYLMTELSAIFEIAISRGIKSPGHVNNEVEDTNTNDK